MIYTGYFAQTSKYTANNLTVISISRWSPKWFTGLKCEILAPSADLLNRYRYGRADAQQYTIEFMEYLKKLDIPSILNYLENFNNNGIVLCCYEKPGDFCHRHLIADYSNKYFGTNITEFPIR